jgi:hypothetical protein
MPSKTQSENGRQTQWAPFGWQGVELRVPAHWQMSAVQGDRRTGYVRLMDENAPRLEIKWQQQKRKPSVASIASEYLSGLARQAKRRKQPFEVTRDLTLSVGGADERPTEFYAWQSDVKAVAMVSWCPECQRVVHIQVLGALDAGVRPLARRIFASLRDHPAEDVEHWAFYDVRFPLPAGFTLEKSDLKTGCVTLRFRRKAERIEISRISVAHLVLDGLALEEWLRRYARKTLQGYTVRAETGRMRGHETVALAGPNWRIRDLRGLILPRRRLRLAAWHCEVNDRLILCSWIGRRCKDTDFAALAAGIACHESEGET